MTKQLPSHCPYVVRWFCHVVLVSSLDHHHHSSPLCQTWCPQPSWSKQSPVPFQVPLPMKDVGWKFKVDKGRENTRYVMKTNPHFPANSPLSTSKCQSAPQPIPPAFSATSQQGHKDASSPMCHNIHWGTDHIGVCDMRTALSEDTM